ncbi:hypothetical protein [Ruegeria atlantica]|uniref:Uncharacterized protein n=1 Tax=Ruegeria atlantica TaxID=81569 RepID=A0ABX1W6M1_9RHOB|nr:hypothetical protein [Ruegeria atlantica]NOD29441.1 hypothetical protein [Ruegeria atlantica]
MNIDEPKLVMSDKCKFVLVDGYRFEIEIYRLDNQNKWTLEAVDCEDASYVWDDKFVSNQEALDTSIEILNNEGALGFMGKDAKP